MFNNEGGAINCSGNLRVNNCNFEHNNAANGGAIFTGQGCFLVVTNSNFTGNTLQGLNGGGGAIYTLEDTIATIKNCTFTDNGKNVFQGGALGNSGFLDVINCQFINNTANLGGAIFSNCNGITYNSTLNVYNSSFTGDNARYGGSFYIDGIGKIDNCNFTSNNATYAGVILNFGNLIINNCKFTDNNATNQGGALLNGGILNLTNCAFTNNSANNGSAIFNVDILNVTNSTFIKNTSNFGGAIFNGDILNVKDSSFISNKANLGGAIFNGAFYGKNGTAIMNFNTIIGNTATTGYAIYNSDGKVDASLNWWGSNNGPSQGTIYGNVTTTPCLTVTAKTSLNGGIYNTNRIITLSIVENANNSGTIYYTMNGSTPTTASPKYNGPITITKNTILKYLAVDTAGYTSPIYTQTYTIDKIPPKVVSTYPANNMKGISLRSPIIIKFSENITEGTNYSKIYVKNLTTGKMVSITKIISGNTLTIKQTYNRLNKDAYSVYIPSAATKDRAGNNLQLKYTFIFHAI